MFAGLGLSGNQSATGSMSGKQPGGFFASSAPEDKKEGGFLLKPKKPEEKSSIFGASYPLLPAPGLLGAIPNSTQKITAPQSSKPALVFPSGEGKSSTIYSTKGKEEASGKAAASNLSTEKRREEKSQISKQIGFPKDTQKKSEEGNLFPGSSGIFGASGKAGFDKKPVMMNAPEEKKQGKKSPIMGKAPEETVPSISIDDLKESKLEAQTIDNIIGRWKQNITILEGDLKAGEKDVRECEGELLEAIDKMTLMHEYADKLSQTFDNQMNTLNAIKKSQSTITSTLAEISEEISPYVKEPEEDQLGEVSTKGFPRKKLLKNMSKLNEEIDELEEDLKKMKSFIESNELPSKAPESAATKEISQYVNAIKTIEASIADLKAQIVSADK